MNAKLRMVDVSIIALIKNHHLAVPAIKDSNLTI